MILKESKLQYQDILVCAQKVEAKPTPIFIMVSSYVIVHLNPPKSKPMLLGFGSMADFNFDS